MRKVAKHKNKLLRLEYFNPWGQFLALTLLFVSTIFVKIMFHSYSFDVNKAIKATFGSKFEPETHEPSGQKQEKIIKSWRFQSMKATLGT